MDFSNYFILKVFTTSGAAHFVLPNKYYYFFDEMQQEFDRVRFDDYCRSVPALSGSDVLKDEILCVSLWSIHNEV